MQANFATARRCADAIGEVRLSGASERAVKYDGFFGLICGLVWHGLGPHRGIRRWGKVTLNVTCPSSHKLHWM